MLASAIIADSATDMGFDGTDAGTITLFLGYLNRSLRAISHRVPCITKFGHHAAVGSQFLYPLDATFLQMRMVKWRGEPPLTKVNLRNIYTMQQGTTVETGTPRRYDLWGKTALIRVTGSATGGSSTTLDDTGGVDFTLTAKVGDVVKNTTDGSKSTVTVVASTQLTFAALTGGTDNTFAAADGYQVESASVASHNLIVYPAPASADVAPTQSLETFEVHEHRLVTQANLDDSADELEIDAELETALFHQIHYWAHGASTPERDNAKVAFESELALIRPKINRRVRDLQSTWGAAPVVRRNRVSFANPYSGYPSYDL